MHMSPSTPYDRPIDRGSRKRLRPSCSHSSRHADAAHQPSKKRRLSHPELPPWRFWENLSKQHVTKNALRALDSTGDRPLNSTLRRSQRLAARRVSESTSDQQRAEDFLRSCSSTSLRRIRRFASHGGPDLRNLRGVSVCPYAHYQS